MRWIMLLIFIACTAYIHWRGKIRHGFFHQLSDHSTFMSPLNGFIYLFSRVPSTPYLQPSLFPELAPIKAQWETIRAEAVALHEASKIQAAGKYNDIGFNSFFRRGWRRFYLKWYDGPHPSAVAMCPNTLAVLRGIPTVKAAMFAMLPPGGTLSLHRDPYAGSLRYHLGLVTPNDDDCAIIVDGERYSWRDGEDVIFDETYLHWAENKTERNRIILFCDIERPMRYRWAQALNRVIGGFLMRAAASPNESGDRTGGLNHAFKYLYSIRLAGKRLKTWNRTAYYILKWLVLGGILVAIFWHF
jgi:beta-hydroxylase